MNYKEVGKTGLKIPAVIFGTSALGNLYNILPDETKLDIVRECVKNVPAPVVFDSAGKYGAGLALEKLGECLTKLNLKEEDVIISNKLGWRRIPLTTPEPTFEKGVWMGIENDAVQDISYDGIMRCYEEGNKLLGGVFTPKLVSVHDPDEYLAAATSAKDRDIRFNNIIEAYKALNQLKKEGRVKAVGVGSKDWRAIEEISKEIDLDWTMFANSMTIMRHPKDLLDFMQSLHNKNVSIINSAVFHAGYLIGGKFFDYRLLDMSNEEDLKIFKWREAFLETCKRHNVSPVIACVKFATSAPGVVSIALNTSKVSHVKGNVESVLTDVPADFWEDMKNQSLISKDYIFLQ